MKQLNEFVRQYMFLVVLLILMIIQIFTWRAVVDLANHLPRNPPNCIVHDPCMVQLDEYTLRQLRPR